jgi:hypothetical protein
VHGLPLPSRCHALDEDFRKEGLKSYEPSATHVKKIPDSFLFFPFLIPSRPQKTGDSPRSLRHKVLIRLPFVARFRRNRAHFSAFPALAVSPRKKP